MAIAFQQQANACHIFETKDYGSILLLGVTDDLTQEIRKFDSDVDPVFVYYLSVSTTDNNHEATRNLDRCVFEEVQNGLVSANTNLLQRFSRQERQVIFSRQQAAHPNSPRQIALKRFTMDVGTSGRFFVIIALKVARYARDGNGVVVSDVRRRPRDAL